LMLWPLLLVAGCQMNQESMVQPILSEEDKSIIDTIIEQKFNAVPVSGLAVGVVVGKEMHTSTMGYSDVSTNSLFTDSTIFCAGVLSEAVTASLSLALEHHYKVSVNTPVAEILNHFSLNSDTYQNISVKNLLTQTSGVPKLSVLWDYPNMGDSALYATTWGIRLLEPEFQPPGTKVVRSPYNFDIAADCIEHASEMPLNQFAKQYMFNPLQMHHSTYKPDFNGGGDFSRPHQIVDWLTYEYGVVSDYPLNGEHAGSIGWHTSINDAVRWISMLLNNGQFEGKTILPSKITKIMTSPHYKTNISDAYMGFGLEIKSVEGLDYYYKTGFIGGYEQSLIMIPSIKTGVVVITNAVSDFQPEVFAQELISSIIYKVIPKYKTPIHLKMGKVLKATQSVDSALFVYEKNRANDFYDCSDIALSQFGMNLHYHLNRAEDALKVFHKCVELFPNSAYAHLNLAEYYAANMDYKQAEKELSLIKKLGDNEFDVKERMALVETSIDLIKEKENQE